MRFGGGWAVAIKNAKRRQGVPAGNRGAFAITGASSFLGKRLVLALTEDTKIRKRILALDIHRPVLSTERMDFCRVDLTKPGADNGIAEIFRDHACDTVIHLAFFHGPKRDESYAHELEVSGTMRLLDACSSAGVRKIIIAGTTGVYGASSKNPGLLKENHRLDGNKDYRYIRDKIEVENLAERYRDTHPGAIVTVLRLGTILGPRARNTAAKYFNHLFVPTLIGYDPLMQFLHEEDAVRALVAAVEKNCSGAYNIVGEGVLPLSTIISLMGKVNLPLANTIAYPLASAFWFFNAAEAPGAHLDYIRYPCLADGRRAKRDLQFMPRFSTREATLGFAGSKRLRKIRLDSGSSL